MNNRELNSLMQLIVKRYIEMRKQINFLNAPYSKKMKYAENNKISNQDLNKEIEEIINNLMTHPLIITICEHMIEQKGLKDEYDRIKKQVNVKIKEMSKKGT